jgi:tRNA-specific 2-thiouridylase
MKNTSSSRKNTSDNIEARSLKETSPGAKPQAKRVYVGMSGGVDSSVSAYLLKEQGYDVTGVFIKVWQPDSTDCGWKDERRDAMRVAAVLDIPFLTFDFSEQYKREVVDYMIDEYRAGRTPNPDVMCNRHVKFGSFLQQALADGVDYVATGHYAQNVLTSSAAQGNMQRSSTNNASSSASLIFQMKEGVDANKDQSYFLWTLTQDDLKHVLFPIGHLEKPEVRKIAEKARLPVFDKKDSQGVCFIGHLDMKQFLKEYIETSPGNVLDVSGAITGTHDGAALYTIGERHGFTFKTKTTDPESHFVIAKDIEKNTITVASKSSLEPSLESSVESKNRQGDSGANINVLLGLQTRVQLSSISFSQDISAYIGKNIDKKISARIRYRQEKQPCVIDIIDQKYVVTFAAAQKGMAEGQSVVLYDGNTCLGGGILNFI